MITIQVLDPIASVIKSVPARKAILPCLVYNKETWIKSKKDGKKRKKIYETSLLNKKTGIFPSGLIPRIRNFCKLNNYQSEILDFENLRHDEKPVNPKLNGLKFRDYQNKALYSIFKHERGIILAPPGSGKTVVIMGAVAAFPESRSLILCHSLDIIHQTLSEMEKYGFKDLIMVGGNRGQWDVGTGKIVLSTIQSFAKLDPDSYMDYFDIVIIDEVHKFSNQYMTVMKNTLAPIRLGFTATMPEDIDRKFKIEGYIGRIISKLTVRKAAELNILAEPSIKLIPVPPVSVPYTLSYAEAYDTAITYNDDRNTIIASQIKKLREKKITTLVMVTQIEHGKQIQKTAYEKFGINLPFIQGSTDSLLRNRVKEALESEKFLTVISTIIFREGVNIPNLGCLILAFGGKSQIATIQALGRALRKTSSKKEALIIDFLDSSKYMAAHTLKRITMYIKNNWNIIS